MNAEQITISRCSARDNRQHRETLSLLEFERELTTPGQVLKLTVEEYFGMSKDKRQEKKRSLAAWSAALFTEGRERGNDAFEGASCIVLDIDDDAAATVESVTRRMALQGWRGVVHTSVSDRETAMPRKLRAVVFCSRLMSREEAVTIRLACARRLGVKADEGAKAIVQPFYLPARLVDGTFTARQVEGQLLNVREVLADEAARGKSGFGAENRRETGLVRAFPDNANNNGDEAHTDDEILSMMRRNRRRGRITRLLAGDSSDYGNDRSKADIALCGFIAYYTSDPEQVRRIFETSALAERDKWRKRDDYRRRTIGLALEGCEETYDWSGGRPVRVASPADTRGLALQKSKSGSVLSTLSNALIVLTSDERVADVFAFNEFSGMVETSRPMSEVFGDSASRTAGEFVEADITPVRAWLGRNFGIHLGKADAADAVVDAARHRRHNPVVEGLARAEGLWDGQARIGAWLTRYLGASTEDPAYLSEVGKRWLLAAVARAFHPGVKVDAALTLEGSQGAGKSTALRILAEAIYPGGFVDSLPVLGDKQEAARALRGAWIVELAELSSIRKAEAESVKAFLSTQADRVRDPYGRFYEARPRTCVFAASTNESEWQPDITGGRRYWPVTVGAIDLEGLRHDAAQLWGEAVRAYKSGEPWHIVDVGVVGVAVGVQEARLVTEAWDDAIDEWSQGLSAADALNRWQLVEVAEAALGISPSHFDILSQRRLGAALRRRGWETKKSNGLKRWVMSGKLQARRGDSTPMVPTESAQSRPRRGLGAARSPG